MTPLQQRKNLFAALCSRFEHRKVSDLVSVVDVRKQYIGDWCRVYEAAELYWSIQDVPDALTPNGMLVPTREAGLEFNLLAQAFYRIMDRLGARDYLFNTNVPFNLRIKRDGVQHTGPRATELKHTDAWLFEDPKSVLVNFFLRGSCRDNHLRYYDPPGDFEESWLSPRQFADGQEIADRYKPLDFVPKDGELVLCDFAAIHQTCRKAGAKDRVSVDAVFGLKTPGETVDARCPACLGAKTDQTGFTYCLECMGEGRINPRKYRGQRIGWDVMSGLGQTHLLVFPNSRDEHVDSEGGRRQAVNCQVKQLI